MTKAVPEINMDMRRLNPEFLRIAEELVHHQQAINRLLKELTEKFPPREDWYWTTNSTGAMQVPDVHP